MMTNAEKIQEWRNTHPAERITAKILRGVLDLDTLRGAYLQDADLQDADLQGATLWDADLLDADLRGANLRGVTLWDADLQGADLQDADLWDADLLRANLRGANLQGANLQGAYLQGTNLRGAYLQGTNLQGTNLQDADLWGNTSGSILQIFGLYPWPAVLVPTPKGWALRVGCWRGTVDELRKLAAQDDGWPEATGEELLRRRPLLYAIADMCDTHIANHADLIDQLAKKWGNRK